MGNLHSIDVVIPSFNSKECLKIAVESVNNQTIRVNRIIIVDDGSDPEFIDYLASDIRELDKVMVVTNSHSGLPGKMRKIGLTYSSSEWVAFLDADDWWESDKLSVQLKIALQKEADLVCTNAISWKNGAKIGPTVQCENGFLRTEDLMADNKVINSSVLVRRKILDLCDEYESSFQTRGVEDYCMWLRFSHFGKLYFLDQPLVNYSVVDGSLSRQFHSNPRIFAHISYYRWLRDRDMLNFWNRRKIQKYFLKGI